MKMNLRILAVLFLLTAIIINSIGCKKTKKDDSKLSFPYTTSEKAEEGVEALYADLRFLGNEAGVGSNNWEMLDATTGIQTTENLQNTELNNLYTLDYNADNLLINQNWKGFYKVIERANLLIESVPSITSMDATRKQNILGEAAFLRSWAYFYLVRLWGDVPLVLKPETSSGNKLARTSQETVYNQIIEDLKKAETSGLLAMDVSGRVSTMAVKSQLAKVYLTMAGQPLNKGAAYYRLAADKAKEVVNYAKANIGTLKLFQDYNNLHDAAFNNRIENIFQIQFNSRFSNPLQAIYLPIHQPLISRIDGFGTALPTPEFYASFSFGDLRTKNREGFFYTDYYTEGYKMPLLNRGKPYIFKHFDIDANGILGMQGAGRSNLNISQIRYADISLVYAEAINRAEGGPDFIAVDLINSIRNRAKLAPIGALSTLSFESEVWRQRWFEFCYEGLTWFDMVRLRKVFNETTKGFDNFVGHINKNSGKPLQTKNLLFPIPSSAIKDNPNLVQNFGY